MMMTGSRSKQSIAMGIASSITSSAVTMLIPTVQFLVDRFSADTSIRVR